MTDYFPSPPSLFGQKGSSKRPLCSRYELNEDNYEGNIMSPHEPDSFPSHKRPKFLHCTTYREEENRQPTLTSSSSSSGLIGRSYTSQHQACGDNQQSSKRFRHREPDFAADFSEYRHHDDIVGGNHNNNDHSNALNTIEKAFQLTVHEKDVEIASLRAQNQQLQAMVSQAQIERFEMEQENKILKKAVGIHDTRQKELLRQNQGLQEVLGKAAEHIVHLEQQNVQLRMELHATSSNKPFGGHQRFDNYGPPDVY